jgi:hypothetical protein
MADFDEAERHAIQEVEPHDQLRWLLEEVDDDLTFFAWLQTQVAPPWIPLMLGANKPEIVRRWRDLAMRQKRLDLRGNYGVLALVFADMAGRKQLWETGLEGFNMQESTIMRQWREEAKKQGIEEGTLTNARAAVVNVLQARFPQTPVPEGVRAALEKNADVQQLTYWHREAVLTASRADFERYLTG